MCQIGRSGEAVDDGTPRARRRPRRVLHPLGSTLRTPSGSPSPHISGGQDRLVTRVDRVGDRLADQVGTDRPAAQPVPVQQLGRA